MHSSQIENLVKVTELGEQNDAIILNYDFIFSPAGFGHNFVSVVPSDLCLVRFV